MSKGFVYVASNNVRGVKGIDYIKEAVFSAMSLKKHNPDANITLITDKKIETDVFTNVIISNDMSLRCKQNELLKSPYEKTLYLDTDTYVNHNLDDIFDLLNKYELVGCNDYSRKRTLKEIPEYMKIPYCFSELNGGVFGYKKCDNFNKFIELWKHYYNKYKHKMLWDQPSLRISLWESNIHLYILPNEYNRRGKQTKEKCINLRKNNDPRFDKNHLKTRIFHFHGLENMSQQEIEDKAQFF